jgi:hypothetical protein
LKNTSNAVSQSDVDKSKATLGISGIKTGTGTTNQETIDSLKKIMRKKAE